MYTVDNVVDCFTEKS